MSDDIENDEIAYVGQTPWHGLGTEVQEGATVEQMLTAAKLDWEVSLAPITLAPYSHGGANVQGKLFQALLPVKAVIRSDTEKFFGIATDRYVPVQNRETVAFFEEFCDSGELELETVGAINGGEWVWALAKVNEQAIAIDGDLIRPYLLIANSHRPGRSLVVKATQVRVVCNNTLTQSLREKSQRFGCVRHDRDVRGNLDNARNYVRAAITYQRRFRKEVERLVRTQISQETAAKLIQSVFRVKPEADSLTRILRLFGGKQIGADTLSTVKDNGWGLFNAVTQYLDFERGRTQDNRLRSAWFGKGGHIKQKMLTELLKLSPANIS